MAEPVADLRIPEPTEQERREEILDLLELHGAPRKTLERLADPEAELDWDGLHRVVGVLDQLRAELLIGGRTTGGLLRGRYPKEFAVDVHELLLQPDGPDKVCDFLRDVGRQGGGAFG